MLKEFRDFLNRGNAFDLAIAFVIGVAFSRIVSSLVEDIVTPLVGVLLGGINFSGQAVQIGEAVITYGNFIQAIIDFILTALALYLLVKAYNRFKRKEEVKEEEPTQTQEVVLLSQIRDLLANDNRPTVIHHVER